MNMCFSIVQKLDVNKIREALDTYERHEKHYQPYLFMNEQTAKDIMADVTWVITDADGLPKFEDHKKIGQFEGVPVFINNSLSYGEVEVR